MQIVLRFLAFVNFWMAYHIACVACITEQWNLALAGILLLWPLYSGLNKAQSDTLYLKNPFDAATPLIRSDFVARWWPDWRGSTV